MNQTEHEAHRLQELEAATAALFPERSQIPQLHTGLFLGAYNPVQQGHIAMARHVSQQLELSRAAFVPSYRHAFGKEMAPIESRKSMLRAALEPLRQTQKATHFFVADLEQYFGVDDGRTIEVIRRLAESGALKQRAYTIVLGIDNITRFTEWHDYPELLQRVPVVFTGRPGVVVEPHMVLPNMFYVEGFDGNRPEYQSTLVRTLLDQGDTESVMNLLPHGVFEYIKRNQLYGIR